MLLQIPDVLTPPELETLLRELARTSFEDGATTAGYLARGVKKNLQLAGSSPAAQKCAPIVLAALQRNSTFFSAALPHRVNGPAFNRYDVGMTYGPHIDNAVMGQPPLRTDVAATLFLSAPDQYDGGELIVEDSLGTHNVKLAAGSMVVYAASSLHHVEPVRRGSRMAAVMWIQSLVRDEGRRRVLLDLDLALGAMRAKQPDSPEAMSLTSVYHNLLRMWAET